MEEKDATKGRRLCQYFGGSLNENGMRETDSNR